MSEQREVVTSQQAASLALLDQALNPAEVLLRLFLQARTEFDAATGKREANQAIVTVRIEAVTK